MKKQAAASEGLKAKGESRIARNLVVVESPTKAKTIQKYLGPDYEVMASYGHVRDLIPRTGAVDPDRGFALSYAAVARNDKHVDAIARAIKKSDHLWLATDPDREGEAIAWHLCELLTETRRMPEIPVARVVFHEITESAIQDALAHPRSLLLELVNAQKARRALDYLYGFNLSPLLWRKIRRGLSAGRVQSPALRLIVEREEEIERFVPREYWSLEAPLEKEGQPFVARLVQFEGRKLGQFDLHNAEETERVRKALWAAADGRTVVLEREARERRRQPAAPFTTSTLQQEMSRRYGLSARKTMQTAQQLYEGIDMGEGAVGLITYMRTDSVQLSNEALKDIRELIRERFSSDFLPDQPRTYKTQTKNAQEAHEAIRPTSAQRTPERVKLHLNRDQFRVYDLIWRRTVASQMLPAIMEAVQVEMGLGNLGRLRATGSTIKFTGFMQVYQESNDDAVAEEGNTLPDLVPGETLTLSELRSIQHFTEPPPRYSEATLVKTLEEYGIGRPSTYATIIETLGQRGYTELLNRRFVPTDVGRVVNRFLTEHFSRYVDYGFTAHMEDELDEISRGEKEWKELLSEFWNPFSKNVADIASNVSRAQAVKARELGIDPNSSRPVTVRLGRFGPFVQIGQREDAEKPKFAGLRSGLRLETITLEEALKLFELPRTLGETPEGELLIVGVGRFGPYLRYGNRYCSLKDQDPMTLQLDQALELVAQEKQRLAQRMIQRFEGGIEILNGRYGPYITDGNKNVKVPKDQEPNELTLEACQALLDQAPLRRAARFGRRGSSAKKSTDKPKTRSPSKARRSPAP
ncbi:DNA topoisomerase I [mine drainage metagenome]|uniref:DNA topoisomerase n=2 Tax=mine drainage metagenome TaxID=410659 RepID=T1BKU1_9ZZZZ